MITAKNYAAQAERAIRGYAPGIADLIACAQHFVIPDGGHVLDDDLRGLRGTAVRLPFPEVTLEYFAPDGGNPAQGKTVRVSKRLVIAKEFEGGFDLWWCGWWDSSSCWMLSGVGLRILHDRLWDESGLFGLEALIHKAASNLDDSTMKSLMEDAAGELWAVLELCEALSCKNVSTEPIERADAAKNLRRIKDGKLPLYETKRLVVEAPVSPANRLMSVGEHRPPRQHLRRGHIRRLASGNIWVNACVVGSAQLGVIRKSYVVRHERAIPKTV